jgi:hypothetical protein
MSSGEAFDLTIFRSSDDLAGFADDRSPGPP